MKSYGYAIIKGNNEYFARQSTFLESKYKKTKYAMLIKEVHKDKSETLVKIEYSNDLEKLQNRANGFISWYNYPMGISKSIQGYLSEL